MSDLTAECLRELFDYNPETGIFTRKVQTVNSVKVGDVVGTKHVRGYLRFRVDGKKYLAHRLAWLYVHGEWPAEELDHINGIRNDNRIVNLRPATKAENMRNQGKRRHNTSGFKGVFFHKLTRKWQASICVDRQMKHLGLFGTPEEAHRAYCEAADRLHGEFARAA